MSQKDLLARMRAELRRTNFAGREVTLGEGVGVVIGTGVLTALRGRGADTAAVLGIGALGLLDDIVEHRQRATGGARIAKGLRGHLRALQEGRLTTGGAKMLGIPVLCVIAAAGAPRPRHALLDGALAAGTANLANLLDLRPGRALKVLLPAAALAALPPATTPRSRSGRGTALTVLLVGAAALPTDLREHGMLGDSGANSLGALIGTALARRTALPVRCGLLAAVIALTIASEKISFSTVIAQNPVLDAVDHWGRRVPEQEAS